MTKTTTNVYEDEAVVADMVERYTAVTGEGFGDEDRAAVVTELAEELGKPEASIRAKLVREKVYVAKTHKTKDGKVSVPKGTMVDILASSLGVTLTDSEATSLEKATKTTLNKLQAAVNALHDEIDLTDVVVDEDDASNEELVEETEAA